MPGKSFRLTIGQTIKPLAEGRRVRAEIDHSEPCAFGCYYACQAARFSGVLARRSDYLGLCAPPVLHRSDIFFPTVRMSAWGGTDRGRRVDHGAAVAALCRRRRPRGEVNIPAAFFSVPSSRKSGSQQTHRWREMDSNFRSLARRSRFWEAARQCSGPAGMQPAAPVRLHLQRFNRSSGSLSFRG